jgi:hypothetical protein
MRAYLPPNKNLLRASRPYESNPNRNPSYGTAKASPMNSFGSFGAKKGPKIDTKRINRTMAIPTRVDREVFERKCIRTTLTSVILGW